MNSTYIYTLFCQKHSRNPYLTFSGPRYHEESSETGLRQFSAPVLFAARHQRKTNSNLSPAVFPQLLSERLREPGGCGGGGGEGQGDTNLPLQGGGTQRGKGIRRG